MSARIISLACVTPAHFAQQSQAADFGVRAGGLGEEKARFARVIYGRSGVDQRASTLLRSSTETGQPLDQDFIPTGGCGPSTGARMDRYVSDAKTLALRAAGHALERATSLGVASGEITHVITVSCTGFAAPGVDHELIERLGLPRTVRRLHVGYMGCHGAINALGVAKAFASEEHSEDVRILLVCVELCSLHFQAGDRADQIVANALFADGAAACVISGSPVARGDCVRAVGGCVFPDSAGAMAWRIGDQGFEMTLGESVPRLIEERLKEWLSGWLDSTGRSLDALVRAGRWAVHPGGPRILDAVQRALGLSDDAMRASRAILREYGNMSSPTVLFILERLRQASGGVARPSMAGDAPGTVLLAFGPGLSVEAALLD